MKELLTKHIKLVIIIVLVIIIILLLHSGFNVIGSLKDQNKALILSRDSSYLQAEYYKNKNGELVAQVNTFELTVSDLKKVGDELGFDNKKLKSQVGSLNNLVGYWKGQAQTHGGDTVTLIDTVYITQQGEEIEAQKLEWTNKYLTLNGLYRPVDKKFSFNYAYDLGGFELTAYRKRQGLFKPKQLVADIKFGDQSLVVTGFQGIVIKEDRKKFWETRGFAIGVGFVGGLFLMR